MYQLRLDPEKNSLKIWSFDEQQQDENIDKKAIVVKRAKHVFPKSAHDSGGVFKSTIN